MKGIEYDRLDRILNHAISSNIGHVLEEAVKQKYDLVSITTSFLTSEVFEHIHEDGSIFSQSPRYILTLLLEEKPDQKKLEEVERIDIDPAYWLGYLFSEWKLRTGESGKEIVEKHHIERIYQAYDMLHTQAITYAIRFFKEEPYYLKNDKREDG